MKFELLAQYIEIKRLIAPTLREWQGILHDIRTSFWEDADDIAASLLSLRLVAALPARETS